MISSLFFRVVFVALVLTNFIACQNKEEKLQGDWHGYFVAQGGAWIELANFNFTADSMFVSSMPDVESFGSSTSIYAIDSFFQGLSFERIGDTAYYWSGKDKKFSFDCNLCGRIVKGRFPNFAQYYLSTSPVQPMRLPIINKAGVKKSFKDNTGRNHDSVPVFIMQQEVKAADGTMQLLPEVSMRYGGSLVKGLKEVSYAIALMQQGHGQSFPFVFFFIDEAVPMEAVDATVFALSVNAIKGLMYLQNSGATEFSLISLNSLSYFSVVKDFYKATLPYFDIYDTLVYMPPYTFGPDRYPIVYGSTTFLTENPIDIFLTSDKLYLGNKPIVLGELEAAVKPLLVPNGAITLGFDGKVPYARFMEVYTTLKQVKDKDGYAVPIEYYPLSVYQNLNPKFSIEAY